MGMSLQPNSRSGIVRKFIAGHPNMTLAEVAKELGETSEFVYQVMYKVKRLAKPIDTPKSVKSFAELNKLITHTHSIVPTEIAKEWQPPVGVLVETSEGVKGVPQTVPVVHDPKDMVNHPSHYKIGGIETIDFIEAKKLDYNLGNAVKYISRADHKGNRVEDLKKARWYIDRAIAST